MSQLRVIKLTVTLDAVIDDGDFLTPVEVAPLEVPGPEIPGFANEGLMEALTKLAARFETPEA